MRHISLTAVALTALLTLATSQAFAQTAAGCPTVAAVKGYPYASDGQFKKFPGYWSFSAESPAGQFAGITVKASTPAVANSQKTIALNNMHGPVIKTITQGGQTASFCLYEGTPVVSSPANSKLPVVLVALDAGQNVLTK